MQIHELPDVTAIGSGGYFATDNGSQTTKIDYDALAKAIIEQYSGSTLAGEAQSVQAALNGIKTDLNVVYGANPIKTLAATDDLLTLDVGMYRVANVLPLNAPSTTYKYGYATKQHRGASGYTYYEFIVGDGNGTDFKRYYGWQYSNSATSIDWIEMAPQSAIDALNSKFHVGNASSGSTFDLPIKQNHIYVLATTHPFYPDWTWLVLISTHSASTKASIATIKEGTGLTITSTSKNAVTMTMNSNVSAWYCLVDLGNINDHRDS